MSSNLPPDPYFNNINFNPNFFKVVSTYITKAYADFTYLTILSASTTYATISSLSNYLLLTGGTITGNLSMPTATTTLSFGSRVEDFLIKLFGNNEYGFGINAGTLRYNCPTGGSHKFYTGTAEKMNLSTDGSLYVNTTQCYLGSTNSDLSGLRIQKDNIFTNAVNGGGIKIWTANTAQSIVLGFFGGNGDILLVNNGSVKINQPLDLNNTYLQLTTSGGSLLGVATGIGQFSTSAAVGDTILRAQTNKKLYLQSGAGGGTITIDTNNYIGLGNLANVNPAYPITINSSSLPNQTISNYAVGGNGAYVGGNAGPFTLGIMLNIGGMTSLNGGLYVYSDERIKKDITPINNSLEIIENLNPVIYKYIDEIQKGNLNNYGLIAQEVEKVVPEVINRGPDFIPNIYKNVDSYDNNSLTLSTEIKDLSIGDKIKLYDINNKCHIRTIINIDGDKINIDEKIEDYEEGSNIFLYGKEEKEVLNVNYNHLFIINLKATQEIYKRLKTLENKFIY